MQLLVSVRDADEARAAAAGGAHIVDAKDPAAGALGAVSAESLAAIAAELPEEIPLSVALGDAPTPAAAFRLARAAARLGAAYVKLGFSGIADGGRIEDAIRAALAGVDERATVIAVAYADAASVSAASATAVIDLALQAGAGGVLLDTARKDRGGLLELVPTDKVERWIECVRATGMLAAVAGSLDLAGVARATELGADVVGVRGAACEGGREGPVSAILVRRLRSVVDRGAPKAERQIRVGIGGR